MGFGDGKGGELGDGEGKEGRKHGITLSSCNILFPNFRKRCILQLQMNNSAIPRPL